MAPPRNAICLAGPPKRAKSARPPTRCSSVPLICPPASFDSVRRQAETCPIRDASCRIQLTQFCNFLSRLNLSASAVSSIPAVWLKPEGGSPPPSKTSSPIPFRLTSALGTNRISASGWSMVTLNCRLGTPDDVWVTCLFRAFPILLGQRARGLRRASRPPRFSFMSMTRLSRWAHRWPKGHIDHQGRKVRTEFRYSAAATARPPRRSTGRARRCRAR